MCERFRVQCTRPKCLPGSYWIGFQIMKYLTTDHSQISTISNKYCIIHIIFKNTILYSHNQQQVTAKIECYTSICYHYHKKNVCITVNRNKLESDVSFCKWDLHILCEIRCMIWLLLKKSSLS